MGPNQSRSSSHRPDLIALLKAIHSILPFPSPPAIIILACLSSGKPTPGVHSMAWIWILAAAGAVLLWALSLGRILSSPAPSCLPPSPHFLPLLPGDRRSRNVLLVVAHPDDESMYDNEARPLRLPLSLSLCTYTLSVCRVCDCQSELSHWRGCLSSSRAPLGRVILLPYSVYRCCTTHIR
jgi:hypothetical protein